MGDLLLKASPRVLENWCGPAVIRSIGLRTVTIGGRVPDHPDNCESTPWFPKGLHLDLSRPECRDHVKRLVARRRWYHDLDESTLVWFCNPVPDTAPGDDRHHRWGMQSNRGTMAYQPAWARKHEGNVPALRELDPYDDTRLPDGSRLVDARALLVVARGVLRV